MCSLLGASARSALQVVISFQGTDITTPGDMVTNNSCLPVPVARKSTKPSPLTAKSNMDNLARSQPSAEETAVEEATRPGKVHSGWLKAWRSVERAMVDLVDYCTGNQSNWRLTCTGHSLGSALATLAAEAFATRRYVFVTHV